MRFHNIKCIYLKGMNFILKICPYYFLVTHSLFYEMLVC